MPHDEYIAANRANWDERVAGHLIGYDTDRFVADAASISEVVLVDARLMAPHLPDGTVRGLRMLHLQCHIGTDTLSWARLGATVTGVDFSPASIAAARDLAQRADLGATFVESTVDDAVDAVEEQFDVVYTSIGALVWLPDLRAWARTVSRTLTPGGLFYVRDTHPMLATLDFDRQDDALVVTHPYFGGDAPERYEGTASYIGDAVLTDHITTYEWPHPISEIITVLLEAGLVIESFQEHTSLPWKPLPGMVARGDDFELAEHPERMPLTFSIAARKPH